MVRISFALALVLALSFAVSSEGLRLQHKERHDAAVGLHNDTQELSFAEEHESLSDGVVAVATAARRRRRSTSSSKCSAKDKSLLASKKYRGNGKTSQGQHSADCGKKAYSVFSGLNKDKFGTCLHDRIPISMGCVSCYTAMADAGAKNCKSACIFSWCSSGCLKCTKKYQPDLNRCTGFTAFPVDAC